MKFLPLVFVIGAFSLTILSHGQGTVSGPEVALHLEKELPAISLRGYGTVSGSYWRGGGRTSLLVIECEDEAKAELVQAKFLSDLQVLPGVSKEDVTVGGKDYLSIRAESQGSLSALQEGAKVYLATAGNRQDLAALLANNSVVDFADAKSTPQIEVPMWLDRWDRYGFRFYYRPWELPPGLAAADYDITEEFEFADASGRSGFVFWATMNQVDTSEGMTNEPWWDWAAKAAEAKNLPVGLNLMSGGAGHSWLTNRYRDQMVQRMPGFPGNYHRIMDPHPGGNGTISWNATTAKDVELGILQSILRRFADAPNLTTILEPHGELRHGNHDIFLEYGPVADAGFQRFLQQKYATLANLNAAWGADWKSWEEVRVPEVASFLGWSPSVLDLTGTWRIRHEELADGADYSNRDLMRSSIRNRELPTEGTPEEWMEEDFDDSSWSEIRAPGDHRALFLPQRPAVFRQSFEVPDAWLRDKPRVWLYVWDLNVATHDIVRVVLNDKEVGRDTLQHTVPHWGAYEVTGLLRADNNQLSIRLPKGFLAYRIYLSPEEPKQYPNLSAEGNARWVDFVEWIGWSRVEMARRGMEMIRGADPLRQIDLMAPGFYADDIKQLALRYGGNFKNTGYMGAFWADELPAIMRGAELPFSLEPSSPAKNLPGFKRLLGLYATEGIQGIDYFIHVGNILWNPDIRKHFEDNRRLIHLFGKYHAPQAEVAALYPTRGAALTGYPWGVDPNTNLGAGYWNWNIRANLRGRYESDGLTESSFEQGDAARYKVVIDTNTSIMDEALVEAIEQYVRGGGTFVTFVQTGRHTAVEKDAWPISRLTGYRVTHIDALDENGAVKQSRRLKPAPGQDIFEGDWSRVPANGLSLEKVAPDARDLMLWQDGSVAIGLRPLGKGYIVQIGCKFSGSKIPDRIEPPGSSNRPIGDAPVNANEALAALLTSLLEAKGIAPAIPAFLPPSKNALVRHYLSNNGLYDVWIAWNQSDKERLQGEIALNVEHKPSWAIDVRDEARMDLDDRKLPVDLGPFEHVAFLTPRDRLAVAPLEWFELQRAWWRGTAEVPQDALPLPPNRFSVNLGEDWAFHALGEGEDGTAFVGAEVDDSGWERMPLGIWSLPDKREVKRAVLRRKFTVPSDWTSGDVSLWVQGWMTNTFADRARIWLDGKLISDWTSDGLVDANPDGVLKPGSQHLFAIEIDGKGSLVGARGSAWLWFWPEPETSLDLAGEWSPSLDALRYDEPAVSLPGPVNAQLLRRTFALPSDLAGKNGILKVEADGKILGVLVNGHWVRRFHHLFEPRFQINITPWLRFGEENEIQLVGNYGPIRGQVKSVDLDFHEVSVYP